jgi:hypothetical protein
LIWSIVLFYRRPLHSYYLAHRVQWSSDPNVQLRCALTIIAYETDGMVGAESILANDDPAIRNIAVLVLAHIKSVSAEALLAELCDDPDSSVRKNAVAALGVRRSPRAIESLLEIACRHGDPLAVEAVNALHQFGSTDRQANRALIRIIRDGDLQAQACAIEAIGMRREKSAVSILIVRLSDARSVRIEPIGAGVLERLTPQQKIELEEKQVMVSEMKSVETTIGNLAARALRRITGRHYGSDDDAASVDRETSSTD